MSNNPMNRRMFLASTVATAAVATTASAQTIDPYQARIRLNLAGRLGTLAQRVAKAATFTALGIDVAGMQAQFSEAGVEFDKIITALNEGDATLGVTPERAVGVQFILEEIQTDWAGTISPEELEGADSTAVAAIAESCNSISAKVETLILTFKDTYTGPSITTEMATTMLVVGRQSQLTQAMTAQIGNVALDVNPEANMAAFAESSSVFGNTLTVLQTFAANYGIVPPPNDSAVAELEQLHSIWNEQKSLVDMAVAEGTLNPDQLAEFLTRSEELYSAAERFGKAYVEKDAVPA